MDKMINRTRRLYSKMDKRKRKNNRKMRKKFRTKKLNKKGGACLGCGSRLKEYYLYDKNGNQVHQSPIAMNKSEVANWKNLGFTLAEA